MPAACKDALVIGPTRYHRPPLSWIKRRARRLQRAHSITRRIAIANAINDYMRYTRMPHERLSQLLKGGHHVQAA